MPDADADADPLAYFARLRRLRRPDPSPPAYAAGPPARLSAAALSVAGWAPPPGGWVLHFDADPPTTPAASSPAPGTFSTPR
jgi:hypothetical protein